MIVGKTKAFVYYCSEGVWHDTRKSFRISILKTLNLSIRSFLDSRLQIRSMSLTYSTVLAIVPAFALLFAIGRGFGLQDIIVKEILNIFPAQKEAINAAFTFVNSYLSEASQGVFIGVGLIMLLWTLISLLSSIGEAFNFIWDVKQQRTFYQKLTDYISICLLVPILMICSSGLSIFFTTTLSEKLHLTFLADFVSLLLEGSPLVLCWIAFSLTFFLAPNTKVKFRYAAASGLICAFAFVILELLLLNGQIYVSRYNAIYGSFAFLPLLLVWLQLSWLIVLFGGELTYSMQNIFSYNFEGQIDEISHDYLQIITLIVAAIVVKRFDKHEPPLSINDISLSYKLPLRIVGRVAQALLSARIVYFINDERHSTALTSAVEPDSFTIAELFTELNNNGEKNFIPDFDKHYAEAIATYHSITKISTNAIPEMLVKDVKIPSPAELDEMSRRISKSFYKKIKPQLLDFSNNKV